MTTKTKQPANNLQPVIKEIHKAYKTANSVLFKDALPDCVITMQSAGGASKGILGWFVTQPIWKNGNEEMLYEINLTPENLGRPYIEVVQTLVHEMVHMYCAINKIKETSRAGKWHNKKFADTASMFGMEYTHGSADPKIGYSAVTFTPETVKLIKFWNIDKSVFNLSRVDFGTEGKKKKGNSIKWVCPSCDCSVRSTKEVRIMCMDCEQPFEKAE